MTVGEKIQFYRKKAFLSQEELGQKLFVSRQTVSLWETDQTVPTIDNLLRLKEIFGVSIDDMLDPKAQIKEEVPELPQEEYCFEFSKDELYGIFRHYSKIWMKRPVFWLVIILVIMTALILSNIFFEGYSNYYFECILIIIVYAVIWAKAYKGFKKTYHDLFDRISKSTYRYIVFKKHFIVEVYKNGECRDKSKIYFSDIKDTTEAGNLVEIKTSSQIYILRKSDISSNSVFAEFLFRNKTWTKQLNNEYRWKTVSNILFAATFFSLLLGFIIVTALGSGRYPKNMGYMYCMTPVPIASIVIGFILKHKGYSYKKNLIAGFIVLAIMCLFGLFVLFP